MSLLNLTVLSVSSGSSFESGGFLGMGMPRLYQNMNLYVYNIASTLMMSSDGGVTFTNIIPTAASIVQSITQVSPDVSVTVNETHIFTPEGHYKQSEPETPTGWTSGNALPTGFVPADAVSDSSQVIPMLVGSSYLAATPPLVEASGPPAYGAFASSDTGLPTGTDVITDLESTV